MKNFFLIFLLSSLSGIQYDNLLRSEMPITFASPWGIKVIRLDKEKCFTFETKVLNEVDSFESSKTITGCYKIEQDMLILSPEYFYTTNKCRDNSQEIKHSSNDLIFLITPKLFRVS